MYIEERISSFSQFKRNIRVQRI